LGDDITHDHRSAQALAEEAKTVFSSMSRA
jgi:hypothetical protein